MSHDRKSFVIEKMTARDLKRFAILGELSEDDRQALFDLLEPKIVRRGRSIYRQTAEAEELIFVVSGTVHLTSGLAPELAPVAEGQVLGIASLFAPGPREATAKAETDC